MGILNCEHCRRREAEIARLKADKAKLIGALKSLILGRSIHNERIPDRKIEGPLWDIAEQVLKEVSHD